MTGCWAVLEAMEGERNGGLNGTGAGIGNQMEEMQELESGAWNGVSQ